MVIGKIVKSNSHTDYICQIYASGEVGQPPAREDYAFGTFVRVELNKGYWLVGIIYDTQLVNPDFGRLGPRLSPQAELAVFSPDYLNEKATLVGIAAVGTMGGGNQRQGVPALAASADTLVERMTEDQVRTFHEGNPAPRVAYAPFLLAQGSPLAIYLLRMVVDRLLALFPSYADMLSVLQDNLTWQSQIVPLGGAR